jgi:hypothetical protein
VQTDAPVDFYDASKIRQQLLPQVLHDGLISHILDQVARKVKGLQLHCPVEVLRLWASPQVGLPIGGCREERDDGNAEYGRQTNEHGRQQTGPAAGQQVHVEKTLAADWTGAP